MIKNMTKSSKQKGFTLVELLVVVVIIGILAAIALPNFISAQTKAKEASVKGNMRTSQIAAESYATDYAGAYPPSVGAAYESYFPGGGNDGSTAGNPLTNPFTNLTGFPADGGSIGQTAVGADRVTSMSGLATTGCGVTYNEVTATGASNQIGYAVMGANATGAGVTSTAPGTTLVLSNM